MGRCIVALAGALLLVPTLASCNIDGGEGYVEIKAIPPSASFLYLDQPSSSRYATATPSCARRSAPRLQTDMDGAGHMALLCNIEVKKNRITSVTVSVMSRQPRCQCGRTSGTDTGANRTCIG